MSGNLRDWHSALEVFLNGMRYINLRFTYLLTLLTWKQAESFRGNLRVLSIRSHLQLHRLARTRSCGILLYNATTANADRRVMYEWRHCSWRLIQQVRLALFELLQGLLCCFSGCCGISRIIWHADTGQIIDQTAASCGLGASLRLIINISLTNSALKCLCVLSRNLLPFPKYCSAAYCRNHRYLPIQV